MPTQIPRGNLPPLNFTTTSAAEIEARVIARAETYLGRTLAPADPLRLFCLAHAAEITQIHSAIDFSAKQNFLSYAVGDYIDHIGDRDNIERLEASAAQTTIRFTLSTALGSVFTIPAGYLLDAGGVLFATVANAEIPIGGITTDVLAQCAVAGVMGNGFLPGQIKTMVQPLPYMQDAVNITASAGGSDVEDDEAYVERIRLSKVGFSVAGPTDAYIYWARTANAGIIDVAATSPTPGVVDIRILMKNGELPTPEINADVLANLSAKNRRPLTDEVGVSAPTSVNYSIDIQYWIDSSDSIKSQTIQAAVNAAVQKYILWQRSKIGRDINPDELLVMVKNAGAKRAKINSPAFAVVSNTAVAREIGEPVISYQGTENE
jgi:phage-related baseplate assembly protein